MRIAIDEEIKKTELKFMKIILEKDNEFREEKAELKEKIKNLEQSKKEEPKTELKIEETLSTLMQELTLS